MDIGLVERFIRAVEDLRIVFRSYHKLDEATKKSIRHQLYVRGGAFTKCLFKDEGCVEELYQATEAKLGHAPLENTVSVDLQKQVLEYTKDKLSKEDQAELCKMVMDSLN